jgi:TPR repeat protein
MHYFGEGVGKDEALALAWMQLAAEEGYTPSQRFMQRHWQQEELVQRQQQAALAALERERMQHAQALGRITDNNQYITLFSRGKDGARYGGATLTKKNVVLLDPRK